MRYRLFAVSLLLSIACGAPENEPEPEERPAPPVTPMTMPGGMRHGDHNPAHGGVVWMQSNDLHFEVVLDPAGKHAVYFSDAMRMELPAAIASDVTITVKRGGGEPDEVIELTIDEYGESWSGTGSPVEESPDVMASVRFVYEGEPYELEFPFFVKPSDAMTMQPPHEAPPP